VTLSLTLFAAEERVDMAGVIAAAGLACHRARGVETMTGAIAAQSALAAIVDAAEAMTSRGGRA